MSDEPKPVTVAELEAMTHEERTALIRASIVTDLSTLPPDVQRRIADDDAARKGDQP